MTRANDAPLLSRRFIIAASLILAFLFTANLAILCTPHGLSVLSQEWLPSIPGRTEQRVGKHVWRKSREPTAHVEVDDEHPIRRLMHEADAAFERYDGDRSKTFKETVEKYRRRYGRHPPPGFKAWYKFARLRKVHSIDDFDQIHSDLRPFWAIPPAELRHSAAHLSDDPGHAVAVISLRDGQVFQETWGWRSETFIKMLSTVAAWLPDMDIPMNRMDQPRVVVPWEDMQEMLAKEESSRSLAEDGVEDGFTNGMDSFWIPNPEYPKPAWLNRWNPFVFPTHDHREDAEDPHPKYGWFSYANRPFMDLASKACPPDSYARNPDSLEHLRKAEATYQHGIGSFVTNANLSSDLCTVGPSISALHGLLYASTSMLATHKLVPIFGECKTNVNNDILFPANMYWKQDKRYIYDDEQDINWDDKDDMMPWRGVTSGGTAYADQPEKWMSMHRQRLVTMMNSTAIVGTGTSILRLSNPSSTNYSPTDFSPAPFAQEHTDIGFTERIACIPNCDFYNSTFTMLNKTTFADTFKSKFLIDVDGHSFSGRWRAFLQSRSLGLKATIFREWHDSRLWAWRHYVPLSNEYSELYSLLTYFIGLKPTPSPPSETENGVFVPRHDYEAYKLASQGRAWAARVLRTEDIEIYLFRLLLEYGRVIDDRRDRIGVVDDGGAEMEEFDRRVPAVD